MSSEDAVARESIRDTIARYNIAGDRLHAEDFIAVFTDDAILETDGVVPPDDFHCRGRDAIAAWIGGWGKPSAEPSQRARKATFIRHHLATCQIDITGPDTATARTYWMAYTDIGQDHCGYYLDKFRKTGDKWLIAHRRVRLDWRSPNSLFTSAKSRTR